MTHTVTPRPGSRWHPPPYGREVVTGYGAEGSRVASVRLGAHEVLIADWPAGRIPASLVADGRWSAEDPATGEQRGAALEPEPPAPKVATLHLAGRTLTLFGESNPLHAHPRAAEIPAGIYPVTLDGDRVFAERSDLAALVPPGASRARLLGAVRARLADGWGLRLVVARARRA